MSLHIRITPSAPTQAGTANGGSMAGGEHGSTASVVAMVKDTCGNLLQISQLERG